MSRRSFVCPCRVSAYHTHTLRLDTVTDIHRPLPAFLKRKAQEEETKDESHQSETKAPEEGEAVAAAAADDEEQWVDGEITNFATPAHGSSVTAGSSNFRASGDDVERTILLDGSDRNDDAAYEFHEEDMSQELVLDLGVGRRLTQIGARVQDEEEEHGVHDHFTVQVSANGNDYVDWNSRTSELRSLVMLEPSAEYAGPEEVRFIRFNFGVHHPSGGSRVHQLLALGHIRTKKQAEVPFPVMTTEGRHLFFMHAGKTPKDEN